MPFPALRLRSSVGNNLKNDPDDIHDLALSLEGAGGSSASDAAKLGIWDQTTRDGVIDFQKRHELKNDGALLPGGETEQNINKLLTSKPEREGSNRTAAIRGATSTSAKGRETLWAFDSQAPVNGINDPAQPSGHVVRSPDEHLPDASAFDGLYRKLHRPGHQSWQPPHAGGPQAPTDAAFAAVPKARPTQPADTRAEQRPNRVGVVPVADEKLGVEPRSKRKPSASIGSTLALPPIALSPWATQAAKRIYQWSREPVSELVEIKRQSLANLDAALAGITKPDNHGLLARISNAIAAGRLRQARAYTDALMPTTKGELATLGISVVGSIATAGKTLMVLRRGNKVFLESTLAQELKLLPHKKTPTHQHHPLPRFGKSDENEIFRTFFSDRGIDIHQIIVHVPAETHLKWLHGGGDRWLIDWKIWIRNNPNATASQVYRFAGEMNYKYGLDGMEFGPYRRSRTRKRVQKSRVLRKLK